MDVQRHDGCDVAGREGVGKSAADGVAEDADDVSLVVYLCRFLIGLAAGVHQGIAGWKQNVWGRLARFMDGVEGWRDELLFAFGLANGQAGAL